MDRREFLAAVGTASVGSVTGCSTMLGSGGEFDVGMRATAFDPATYRVEVGEEVVWQNTSSRGHTVTAYESSIPDEAAFFASGGFETEQEARNAFWDYQRNPDGNDRNGLLTSGDTFRHTFEVAGEHSYLCIPHEQGGMVGTVVVEE